MFSYVVAGGLAALGTALALAWKWQLGLRRTAAAVTALATASATLVTMLGKALALSGRVRAVLTGASTLAGAFAVLAYRFYRDPERVAPDRDDAIVSPADGTVLYVHHSSNGELPVATKHGRNYTLRELTGTPLQIQSAIVIGIGMSFLDVHVNRAPIAGRIASLRRFPGLFGSLRDPHMIFANERVTTVIENGDLQVAVVQIASRLVRQIASFVNEGQEVSLGQRIGVIRLGSQVDLVLPAVEGLRVTVRPGEHVTAGESILGIIDGRGLRGIEVSPSGVLEESRAE
ncbi:phosphatidylserine decarboxylase [Sphaerobacter thermophilus]|uniref:Phosphatidylserine decarboxylase related protein n=1 Tax=Sphaerobacter thermophilus (strain ATCC 49802 / DSM 20745 / KCCM 41009 / NCIMB 13125 / S 6022) TaxID=479434 RepID=D1C2W7_SPHTD|nr:phosphatidylserine decarboxylase [Sphaerobacter thermophilus]ACZ38584.1 phosphatidylserine decarboxylase related protein [Sphaerobacter thermophilus DSM 20745]